MRILIEEYQYDYEDVRDVLKGFGVLPNETVSLVSAMLAITSMMTQM